MLPKKKIHAVEKSALHPRNQHRKRYDFKMLTQAYPTLAKFVRTNEFQDQSIDFANPEAVLALNKALLKAYYHIQYWEIPKGYLCPPIPGRADYIHYAADLLASCNQGSIPRGAIVNCLDVGVGANCIYPIVGHQSYAWHFVGADVDSLAIQSAKDIVQRNSALNGNIEIRKQIKAGDIFRNIIQANDYFDLTICNPPFHRSQQEAEAGTLRKQSNLKGKKVSKVTLNFGGQSKELWCDGGEERFVQTMIKQSKDYAKQCLWFTSLVAKSIHLKSIYVQLKDIGAEEVRTITMHQGNKTSRFVAWTFLPAAQQKQWTESRWIKNQKKS